MQSRGRARVGRCAVRAASDQPEAVKQRGGVHCGARHHDAVHAPANHRRSRYAAAADGSGDHRRVRPDLDYNQCGHDNDYSRVVVCLQNNDDLDAAHRG